MFKINKRNSYNIDNTNHTINQPTKRNNTQSYNINDTDTRQYEISII